MTWVYLALLFPNLLTLVLVVLVIVALLRKRLAGFRLFLPFFCGLLGLMLTSLLGDLYSDLMKMPVLPIIFIRMLVFRWGLTLVLMQCLWALHGAECSARHPRS